MSHHKDISWWSHWSVIFPVASPERWVNKSQGNCSVWPHQNWGVSLVCMLLLIIFLRWKACGQLSHMRGNQGAPLTCPCSCGDLTCRDVAEVRWILRSVNPYVPESEVSLYQGLSEISSPSVLFTSENSNWDISLPSKFLSLFSCIRKFYINTKFYN